MEIAKKYEIVFEIVLCLKRTNIQGTFLTETKKTDFTKTLTT